MRCESTNKISFRASFIFMIISLMVVVFYSENCFAEDTIASGAMNYALEHSINSVIYDNYKYGADGEKGLALTSNGITYNNWEYTDSKYLQVTMMVEAKKDEVHILEIKLDKLFYSVSDVTHVPSGFSKVEIVKNPDISANGGRNTYTLNKGSVTLRYYLKPNMTRATIRLELRYDPIIWDKCGNSPLTPEGVSPIIVSLGHEKSSDNFLLGQYSSMVHLAKATSGKRIFGDGDVHLKRNWNTTYWDAKDDYFGYKDDTVRLRLYLAEDEKLDIDRYLKKVIVDIDVPYYEKNGIKYYMDYDVSENFLFEETYNDTIGGIATKTTETHISFYLDGFYSPDNKGIFVDFKWPRELTTNDEFVEFNNGGNVVYKFISNADKEVVGFTHGIGNIKLATRAYEDVCVYDMEQSVTMEGTPSKICTRLGNVYLKNDGTGASTEKEMYFKFNRKHLVTSMRLPADTLTKEYVVQYTLKNNSGNPVTINGRSSWTVIIPNENYNTDLIDNLNVLIKRGMLPDSHVKYYFDTIRYTLKTIKKRTRLYFEANDTICYSKCTGIFYGKIAKSAYPGEQLNGTLIMTSPQGSGIPPLVYTMKSSMDANKTACYGVKNAKFSKSEIKAGESVETSGDLWVSDYIYRANSTWINKIRFALMLPDGVTIDRNNIDIRTNKNNLSVDVRNMVTKKIDNQNTLWIIDVDPEMYVGHYNESLGQNANHGNCLKYKIILNTSKKVDASALHTDEMVFLAPLNQPNVVECCRKAYATEDIYDINGDGNKNDMIGVALSAKRESCSIASDNLALDIKDNISIIGEGSVDGRDACIKSDGDIIQYDLSIVSKNDGVASSFDYYIPIMKSNLTSDEFLITSSTDTAFGLELLGEARMEGDDIYLIEYTTRERVSYTDARGAMSESDWFTATEMSEKGVSYKDVTLMRITVKGGKIDSGMDTTISIQLKYQGDNIYADKGKLNAWRGCGYYDYDDGYRFVSGHFPTPGVSATVDVTEPPKNNIIIDVGVVSPQGRILSIYDAVGYQNVALVEPIEFMVERNRDSDPCSFVISKSDDYNIKEQYLNKSLVYVRDENGDKVEPNAENVYNLNANKKYKMYFARNAFNLRTESKMHLYLHSYASTGSTVEDLLFIRASAFNQN